MADRSEDHPWGTCDGCGVDLGGVCCYEPHQLGDYDTLCHSCFTAMKQERDEQWRKDATSGIPTRCKKARCK